MTVEIDSIARDVRNRERRYAGLRWGLKSMCSKIFSCCFKFQAELCLRRAQSASFEQDLSKITGATPSAGGWSILHRKNLKGQKDLFGSGRS